MGAYRAAIVGVSGFGRTHYNDLVREWRRGRAEIVAATVIDEDDDPGAAACCAVLRGGGCRIFRDYRAMLDFVAGRIDLCCIPTGIAHHAPMTLAALSAGANVFVEKPAAATVDDIDRMIAAEQASGRFAAVGFQHLYQAAVLTLKRRLLDGRIGRIRRIRTLALWPRTHAYYARNNWAGRLSVDGRWVLDSPINNALAHYLNLMLFLCGPTPDRSARPAALRAQLLRANDIESFDTALLRCRLPGGVRLDYYVTHACRERANPVLTIDGDGGRVEMDAARIRIESEGAVEELALGSYEAVREEIFAALADRLAGRSGAAVATLAAVRNHTLAVNAMHTFFPIRDVSASRVAESAYQDSRVRHIRGVEDDLRAVYRDETFLPWADAPDPEVDLAGYDSFTGVHRSVAANAIRA